ncbi:MAG: class I SAM-dependent methyltransferase [Armatimonadetes bacterium]|nr:class I SAM-dependent methyltransferase [Armatimonadota bacterium]
MSWIVAAVRKIRRAFRPMQEEYRERFSMTLRDWLLYHQRDIVFEKCSWMGVPTLKNPLDAWVYQEIVHEVRPEVIVEIGSAHGGSTLFFAHLLDLVGQGRVVSVDVDRTNYRISHPRITAITGDSADPQVIERVQRECQGQSVLVMQDGGHMKEQVLSDLRAYSGLVTPGSYFIVEDSIVDLFKPGDSLGFAKDGPLAAIEEFLVENPDFVIDAKRERYLLTYNPRGFLRRI